MPKIVIEFDNENRKEGSKVSIDGKVLENVYRVSVYGMGTDYASLEIAQQEMIGEGKGAMYKTTTISASEKDNFQTFTTASEGSADPEVARGISDLLKNYRK